MQKKTRTVEAVGKGAEGGNLSGFRLGSMVRVIKTPRMGQSNFASE